MKNIFTPLVILTTIPLSSLSQEFPGKVREIGVSFSSLNNFGIVPDPGKRTKIAIE